MAELSSILNRDKTKVSIGISSLAGYEAISKTMAGNSAGRMTALGGATEKDGMAEIDGMAVAMKAGTNFIDDNTLKHVVCTVNAGYSIPLKVGEGVYMATAEQGDPSGMLCLKSKGIPSNLNSSIIGGLKAESTGSCLAGIGLDLGFWGDNYMKEFFTDHSVGSKELQLLAEKNLLCSEVVMHQGSVGDAGKVFYVNVVDCKGGLQYVALFSPIFACLSDYKDSGLSMEAENPAGGGVISLGDATPAGSFSYDYKTGQVSGCDPAHLEGLQKDDQGQIKISSNTGCVCRLRLFVSPENQSQAEQLIGKPLPAGFTEYNKTKEYNGGQQVVQTGQVQMTGNIQTDITNVARRVMEFISREGITYVLEHGGFYDAASAPLGLGPKLQAAGLKYLPKTSATGPDGQTYCGCDCSYFCTWVLCESGYMDPPSHAPNSGAYGSMSATLKSGYGWEQAPGPEPGCVCWRNGHVAIGISTTQCCSFGSTAWMPEQVPQSRKDWNGKKDNNKHGRNISFRQPQALPKGYSKFFRIVKK